PLRCSTVSFPRRQIAGWTLPFASTTSPTTVVSLNAVAPPPNPRSGSRMMAGRQAAAAAGTEGGTAVSPAVIAAAAAAAHDMIRVLMALLHSLGRPWEGRLPRADTAPVAVTLRSGCGPPGGPQPGRVTGGRWP